MKLETNVKNFISTLPSYIKKLNLVLIGNSIIAGYRRKGKIKKLFFKENMYDEIKNIFDKSNIELNIFDFSRPQDNGNRRILELIVKNTDLNTMNFLSIKDVNYLAKLNNDTSYISNEDMYQYQTKNIYINDILSNKDKDTYTIILFGGCTGRILETFFKKPFPKNLNILKAFKEDLKYLANILDYILFLNPNIPCFITGMPEIKYLNFLIYFFNRKIKNLCNKKFNAIYFSFGKKNLKYTHENETFFDLHPDEKESKNLIINFFDSLKKFASTYHVAAKYYETLREFNLLNYDENFPEMETKKFYSENEKYFDKKIIYNSINYFYKKGYIPEKVHDFHGTNIRPI